MLHGFKASLEVENRDLFLSQWWAGASGSSSGDPRVKYSGILHTGQLLVAGNLL